MCPRKHLSPHPHKMTFWPCTFQFRAHPFAGFSPVTFYLSGSSRLCCGNKRPQILSGLKQRKLILAYSPQGQLGISSRRDTGFQNVNHLENYLVGNHPEFQRIARRDKKAFLSDQRKEIEENNRMGKTRDLFKKIRDTKGTFHEKMGSIKDRNGMDVTEAEDIRRGGKNTQKNYTKKICMTQISTMV